MAHFTRLPRFLGEFRVHPHQKTSAELENVDSVKWSGCLLAFIRVG